LAQVSTAALGRHKQTQALAVAMCTMAVSMRPRKISAASPMSICSEASGSTFDDEPLMVVVASDASTCIDDEPLMVALPDYRLCATAPKELNDCLVFGDAHGSSDEESRFSNTGLAQHLKNENRRLEAENARLRMQYANCTQMASDGYCPWNVHGVYGTPMAVLGYGGPPGLAMPKVGLEVQAQLHAQGQSQSPHRYEKPSCVYVNAEADAELEFDGDCSEISSGRDVAQAAPRTTVMLRNLPNSYTRQMLMNMLDAEGFAGLYDFVYCPIDFKSHLSLAYAFINLVSVKETKRFWKQFHGYSNWVVPSHKIARVNWSEFQGLADNVERYRNSPVMHEAVPDEYKPVLLSGTERMTFPAPTEKMRAPRRRMHAKALQPGRVA